MARPYNARRRRLPDAGELIGLIVLAVIGLWGLWFGVQSLSTLWWPLNLAYSAAGAVVACISFGVGWALLDR